MKRKLVPVSLALVFAAGGMLHAQKSKLDVQLERALKLYPDSDADKDGKLSVEEALKYLAAHPELRALLVKTENEDSAKRVWSKPGAATSASHNLPAGPRVFVCAHSFMIYTAQLLPAIAHAAGIAHQDAGRQMIGGSRVVQHWNVPDEKNEAKAALREGKVDVLTVSPHMVLPDEGIDNFTKLGLEKNPNLRVIVQASWPAHDGVLNRKFSNAQRDTATVESLREMREKFHATWLQALEAQVRGLNAATGREAVTILPVCEAVFALRERIAEGTAPGLTRQTDLFRDDLGHPEPPLAALVAYCHFAHIYGRSPIGLPVPSEIRANPQAEQLNSLLQQLAWNAVTQYPMSGVKAVGAE